jgi:hypothetical protein
MRRGGEQCLASITLTGARRAKSARAEAAHRQSQRRKKARNNCNPRLRPPQLAASFIWNTVRLATLLHVGRGPKGSPVEIVISLFCFSGAQAGMSESHHRSCQCGAVYSRTEAMAPKRQIASFECSLCDTTLETWNTAWVPTYQFLAGPVRLPNSGTNS